MSPVLCNYHAVVQSYNCPSIDNYQITLGNLILKQTSLARRRVIRPAHALFIGVERYITHIAFSI